MIKINVMNMNAFLQTVNECTGAVQLIGADGKKRNITRQDALQQELRHKHRENRNCLRLVLEIPNPSDYLKIVYFTVGDC